MPRPQTAFALSILLFSATITAGLAAETDVVSEPTFHRDVLPILWYPA